MAKALHRRGPHDHANTLHCNYGTFLAVRPSGALCQPPACRTYWLIRLSGFEHCNSKIVGYGVTQILLQTSAVINLSTNLTRQGAFLKVL